MKPSVYAKQPKALLAVALACTLFPVSLAGAPVAAEPQIEELIAELRAQLQRGEQERLIDPWFLRDLRQAIDRYDNPWDVLVFEDSFSNRGPQPAAPWQVVAGEMLVDWRYGMRSVVEPVAVDERDTDAPRQEPEDPLGQIFGALLKKATGAKQQQPSQSPPALDLATETRPAVAIVAKQISNAFSIRLELTTRPVSGIDAPRFELGPYQGQNAAAGYRLAVLPGSRPSLELTSVSSRNTLATIDLYDEALVLDDGKAHVLEWTRAGDGRMIVRVDGAEVMNVADRRFNGAFDGFSVANQGGDFALRSIRIDGTDQAKPQ